MDVFNFYDLSVELLGELPPQYDFLHYILIFIMAIVVVTSVILIIKLSFSVFGRY